MMVEEVNPTDNVQVNTSGNPEELGLNLEELKEEDGAIEIDFDAEFQPTVTDSEQPVTEDDTAEPAPNEQSEGAESAFVAELEQQIAELKSQLEERTSLYARINADFENFRKRTSREKEELEDQIKCNTISGLLEVVDNFERARSQIKPQNEGEMAIHKSYQSVYKQLVDGLKRLGVSPMRAEGQEFNPNLHEAVMREPTNEYPEGVVIEEFVRGYLLGERVLRHAMVKVATAADSSADGAIDATSGNAAESEF